MSPIRHAVVIAFAALAFAALTIAGCSSKPLNVTSDNGQPTGSGPGTAATSQTICKISVDPGDYYLLLTSAAGSESDACDDGTPFSGTLDDLRTLPGMDRRCVLNSQFTAENSATGAVYSDTKKGDRQAATDRCALDGD